MESILLSLAGTLLLIGLCLIPWLVVNVNRAVPTDALGYFKEKLVLGTWFQTRHLDARRNKLGDKVKKLEADLKRHKKLLEDEELRINQEIDLINFRYRDHLAELGGKRHWLYLGRQTPTPSPAFLERIQSSADRVEIEQRTNWFTLERYRGMLPEFSMTPEGVLRQVWYWALQPQRRQNNQKKKGGDNQGNNQQQDNQNNNSGGGNN